MMVCALCKLIVFIITAQKHGAGNKSIAVMVKYMTQAILQPLCHSNGHIYDHDHCYFFIQDQKPFSFYGQ